MKIRRATQLDRDAIRAISTAAFGQRCEALLVDALRDQASPTVERVASLGAQVLGHILFSPVALAEDPASNLMGLAPMSVLPTWQKNGVGSALVRAGIAACTAREVAGIVVLGHPHFYTRFGFRPASQFGLTSIYDVPDDVFMAIEITTGSLQSRTGTVRYHSAFDER